MPRTAAPLVVGTWNTHVSIALRNGGLRWLLQQAPGVHLWMLQEVREVSHIEVALREAGALGAWRILPAGGHVRDGGLPFILVRNRPRFRVRAVETEPMAPAAFPRERVSARIRDRRTGRLINATSVHVDPLGRGFQHANARARARHEAQVQVIASAAARRRDGHLVLDAGDWNERLAAYITGGLRDRTAVARMARAGSAPAFRLARSGSREVRLDDVFVRPEPWLEVRSRRVLTPPVRGNDHPAVVVRLRVQAAPAR